MYKWVHVLANSMLGVASRDGLASHPEGVEDNTPTAVAASCCRNQLRSGLMGLLACMQTLPR